VLKDIDTGESIVVCKDASFSKEDNEHYYLIRYTSFCEQVEVDGVLRDKYDCRVPDTFEELLALPGVGRKSANLIMGDVFGKPAIVTDTHCIRLCNKIGLVDGIKEPQKVEMALWKIIPPEEGSDLCHRFVMHGRAVCNARKPDCEKCCLKDVCRTAREAAGQQAEPQF
jgi:endonuclease-3